jgi:GNAT superfamily N-acetyltransferase
MLIPRLKNNVKEIPYNKENVLKYKSPDNLLRHARTDKGCTGVMLISGNSLIGYVGWQGEMIIALEITKSYRGQGYGEYLVKRALDSGCTRLTVDSTNTPAINLYKKMGFVVKENNGKRLGMKQKSFSGISVGKRTGILKNLIFVSSTPNLERELLDPTIPRNFLTSKKYIDHQLPRFQLYTTVDDAISGKYLNETPEPILYVYRATRLRNESLIKPGLSDCPYGLLVEEYWSLVNVKPELLGVIEVETRKPVKKETYKYGPRQLDSPLLRWSWKEKLEKWEKPKLKKWL